MTKKEIDEMKKLAEKYSMRFINRKTVQPDPKLALAFEAGFKAALNKKSN